MSDSSLAIRRWRAGLVLGVLGLAACCGTVTAGLLMGSPLDPIVQYGERTLPDRQFRQERHRAVCGFLPLSPLEQLTYTLARQTTIWCFDTDAEYEAWRRTLDPIR